MMKLKPDYIKEKMKSKIGLAIPCFNNLDVIKKSLPAVYSDKFLVVLFDDGSTDGTKEWVQANYPNIEILSGDGENWWTGSLAKAIDFCLANECDYVVSINADVLISPKIVQRLIEVSIDNGNAIVASMVVDIDNPDTILWSGSKFKKIHKLVPIYSPRYIVKAGNKVNKLSDLPFEVDEVHGRGVLIPRSAFEILGNYDGYTFPHYGGDNDFSFRAKRHGIKMLVDPLSIARVHIGNTSLNLSEHSSFWRRLGSIKNYLFVRKNGEAVFVWWKLYRKHLPPLYFLQSYIFILILNVYRRLGN